MSSVSPGGADLVPTTPDWPAWVGFMVTTHFDLVSGPFHSPIFIGLHSVSTSANMYHLNTRAGELPRSASSHFHLSVNSERLVKVNTVKEPNLVLLRLQSHFLLQKKTRYKKNGMSVDICLNICVFQSVRIFVEIYLN